MPSVADELAELRKRSLTRNHAARLKDAQGLSTPEQINLSIKASNERSRVANYKKEATATLQAGSTAVDKTFDFQAQFTAKKKEDQKKEREAAKTNNAGSKAADMNLEFGKQQTAQKKLDMKKQREATQTNNAGTKAVDRHVEFEVEQIAKKKEAQLRQKEAVQSNNAGALDKQLDVDVENVVKSTVPLKDKDENAGYDFAKHNTVPKRPSLEKRGSARFYRPPSPVHQPTPEKNMKNEGNEDEKKEAGTTSSPPKTNGPTHIISSSEPTGPSEKEDDGRDSAQVEEEAAKELAAPENETENIVEESVSASPEEVSESSNDKFVEKEENQITPTAQPNVEERQPEVEEVAVDDEVDSESPSNTEQTTATPTTAVPPEEPVVVDTQTSTSPAEGKIEKVTPAEESTADADIITASTAATGSAVEAGPSEVVEELTQVQNEMSAEDEPLSVIETDLIKRNNADVVDESSPELTDSSAKDGDLDDGTKIDDNATETATGAVHSESVPADTKVVDENESEVPAQELHPEEKRQDEIETIANVEIENETKNVVEDTSDVKVEAQTGDAQTDEVLVDETDTAEPAADDEKEIETKEVRISSNEETPEIKSADVETEQKQDVAEPNVDLSPPVENEILDSSVEKTATNNTPAEDASDVNVEEKVEPVSVVDAPTDDAKAGLGETPTGETGATEPASQDDQADVVEAEAPEEEVKEEDAKEISKVPEKKETEQIAAEAPEISESAAETKSVHVAADTKISQDATECVTENVAAEGPRPGNAEVIEAKESEIPVQKGDEAKEEVKQNGKEAATVLGRETETKSMEDAPDVNVQENIEPPPVDKPAGGAETNSDEALPVETDSAAPLAQDEQMENQKPDLPAENVEEDDPKETSENVESTSVVNKSADVVTEQKQDIAQSPMDVPPQTKDVQSNASAPSPTETKQGISKVEEKPKANDTSKENEPKKVNEKVKPPSPPEPQMKAKEQVKEEKSKPADVVKKTQETAKSSEKKSPTKTDDDKSKATKEVVTQPKKAVTEVAATTQKGVTKTVTTPTPMKSANSATEGEKTKVTKPVAAESSTKEKNSRSVTKDNPTKNTKTNKLGMATKTNSRVDDVQVEDIPDMSKIIKNEKVTQSPPPKPTPPPPKPSPPPKPRPPPPEKANNRAEKKSRKSMQKMGMRYIPGVLRATIKLSGGNGHYTIYEPDVFEKNGSYIVFGEAKAGSGGGGSNRGYQQAQALEKLKSAVMSPPTPPSQKMGHETATGGTGRNKKKKSTKELDIDPKDLELVIRQVGCSRDDAVRALRQNDGDIVNAIMSMTS